MTVDRSANIADRISGKHVLLAGSICFALFFASVTAARYLQWGTTAVTQLVLFGLALWAGSYCRTALPSVGVRPVERLLLIAYSVLLSATVVVSRHIVISNNNTYSGLASENFMTPFGFVDVVAGALVACLIFLYALALHTAFRRKLFNRAQHGGLHFSRERVSWPLVLVGAVVVFLMWLPYLLAYWPGFVFGDTIASINQAVGTAPLSNHHPVAYTLSIRLGLQIARALGFGRTVGIALVNGVQMGLVSLALSYSAAWVRARLRLPLVVSLIMLLCFGLTPTFGAFSIAMWKDPVFTAAFLVHSLCLGDLVISRGRCVRSIGWLALFFLSSLVAMLLRNNGMYVILVIGALLLLIGGWSALRSHKRALYAVGAFPLVASLACYFVVTGPIFTRMGVVPTESVEAVGVPLNQMARVAACDGDMTESDREYLGSVLPFEMYKDVYAPCCTDPLKWNPSFDIHAMENGMMGHWLSMFKRNPKLYFESWVLQTYGFWSINGPLIFEKDNIGGGVPRNLYHQGELPALDIYPDNLLGSQELADLLDWNASPIPSGVLVWGLLFLALELLTCGLRDFTIMMLPSLGVVGTLWIASPIWYWARYAAILNFMLPVWVCFIVTVCFGTGFQVERCNGRSARERERIGS